MQKGVFTTWIKELCALVFLQTIQAFILAIVLSVMLTFISYTGANISDQVTVSSLGVLCIVLLTSLTKMEQITKKIFGLESSFLQTKPPHGLAASFLALKSISRVFNNLPKIAGGVGAAIGAGNDKKKANAAFMRKLNNRGLDYNGNRIENGQSSGPSELPAGSAGTGQGGGAEDSAGIDNARRLAQQQYNSNVGANGGSNTPINPNATSGAAAMAAGVRAASEKDRDAFEKYKDQLDADLAKASEKRRKGLQTAASGLLETAGAGFGAMAGLSVSSITALATNDFDQIPKGISYGAGLGDAAGENLTKAVSSVSSGIRSKTNANKALDKQLTQMENALQSNKEHRGRQAKRLKNIMDISDKNSRNNTLT